MFRLAHIIGNRVLKCDAREYFVLQSILKQQVLTTSSWNRSTMVEILATDSQFNSYKSMCFSLSLNAINQTKHTSDSMATLLSPNAYNSLYFQTI